MMLIGRLISELVNRIALAMLMVFGGSMAIASDFPLPPDGFSWVEFEAGKSAFLKPEAWFQRIESKDGTEALFITKEDIGVSGRFSTGLTVNYVSGIKAKTGLLPSQYAQVFLYQAEKKELG